MTSSTSRMKIMMKVACRRGYPQDATALVGAGTLKSQAKSNSKSKWVQKSGRCRACIKLSTRDKAYLDKYYDLVAAQAKDYKVDNKILKLKTIFKNLASCAP